MNGLTTEIEKRHSYWYFTVVFQIDGNTKVTCEGARTTRKASRACVADAKASVREGVKQVTRG